MGVVLLQNKEVLYDDSDEEVLLNYNWYVTVRRKEHSEVWYVVRRVGNNKTFLHNDLLGIKLVDHVNGNGLDNRRTNLRKCTYSQNGMNKAKSVARNFTSSYKGVGWCKRTGRWRAYITIDRRFRSLGYFQTEAGAARAYDVAAVETFGEFARLNFPEVKL